MKAPRTLETIEHRIKGVERRERHHPHPGEVVQKCRNAARLLLGQYRQYFNEEARKLSDQFIANDFQPE
jgi:hypothetical protein